MAFKTAAYQKAIDQAEPVLLEPMAHLEITVPDSYAGFRHGRRLRFSRSR